MVEEFKTMVGPMMESLDRETARATGTTEDQAGNVLATAYPAVAEALNADASARTDAGFGKRLKDLAA